MLHNISVNKYCRFFFLITIISLLLILAFKLHLDMVTDDNLFSLVAKTWNRIDFFRARYQVWTGRIPLEVIMLATINYPVFWKIAIPLSSLLLSTSISRIICQKVTLFYTFIALVFLFLMPLSINANAAWWITGYYNYLLPLSLATYAISFMLNKVQGKIEFVIVCLTAFIFPYSEQIGIYFLLIILATFCFVKETRNYKNFCVYILAFINYLVLMVAPGNYVRLIAETWNWFPDYFYYSSIQKLCFGFDRLHQLFGLHWNIPLIAFMFLLAFLYIVYGTKFFIGNLSVGTIIIFISISLLQWSGYCFNFLGKHFLNANILNADKWIAVSTYVSYFFVMMAIISLIILTISTLKSNYVILMVLATLLTGTLSVICIGFSPTIYASNFRIYYVFEVCCVMNCMFLIHYINQLNYKDTQQTL